MRKIIVLMFVSMDGVIQAPGGPDEDTSGGFKYGGWTVPYFDDFSGKTMAEQMSKSADLLLGRNTFDIFAGYWPQHEEGWRGINDIKKYVVSRKIKEHDWNNSVFLKNVEGIKMLKQGEGVNLHVYGSSELVQTLLHHDLVDELWLKIFPITLGEGKHLFGDGTIPAAFELVKSAVSPKGVIFANYRRAGKVETGSFTD